MSSVRAVAGVTLLVLVGCVNPFAPDVTVWGRRSIDPVPSEYATWYAEVEVCLGQRGRFGDVEWFVAEVISRDGRSVAALTEWPDRITMTDDYAGLAWAVKHEMIHHVSGLGDEIHGIERYYRCQTTT